MTLTRKHLPTKHERDLIDQARAIKTRVAKANKAERPKPVMPTAKGQRQPRVKDNGRLKYIRRCPCLSCIIQGAIQTTPTRAAHVRTGYIEAGWRHTGKAEKPDDARTLPLCDTCHTDGPTAQHKGKEAQFWNALGVYPPEAATSLGAAYALNADPVQAVYELADRLRRQTA